jgi:uncharacterized protein (DUF4415 family)
MSKTKLTRSEQAEIEHLVAMSDESIDTTDIPEAAAENWLLARRGEFYRPKKTPVTIRLDADVLAWFKTHTAARGYQTEINRVLREHVLELAKREAGSRK